MGHDFRPEYRQLAELRQLFHRADDGADGDGHRTRVRHDIVTLLRLREPVAMSPASTART